jgi:hypothetical protein
MHACDDALLDSCKLQGDSLVASQKVTIDTLELDAQTLRALVDDGKICDPPSRPRGRS